MAKVTFDTHTNKAARLFLKFYGIEDKFKKNGGIFGLGINLIGGSFAWYSTSEGHKYWLQYNDLWKDFYKTGQITINEKDVIDIYDIKYLVQKDAVDGWYLRNELSGANSEIFAKLGLSSSNFGTASVDGWFPWQNSLKQLTETVCKLLDKWYEIMPDDDCKEEAVSTPTTINELSSPYEPGKLIFVDLPWLEVDSLSVPKETINSTDSFTYKPTKQTFKL